MISNMKINYIFILLVIFSISCAEPVIIPVVEEVIPKTDLEKLDCAKIAINIASEQGNAPVLRVYPWNTEGKIKNNLLIVVSSDKENRTIGFNAIEGCFFDYLNLSGDKKYILKIHYGGDSDIVQIPFSHPLLIENPVLLFFRDESNNNGLASELLDGTQELYFLWKMVNDATSYNIVIYEGSQIVFEKIANENSSVLMPNILKTGSYSLRIEAIFEEGDSDYKDSPTYSKSIYRSEVYTFDIQ